MKSHILQFSDNITSIFNKTKTMAKNIPIDDWKKRMNNLVESTVQKINDGFLDQIEMLNFQLKDQEEAARVLSNINANLTLRNKELEAKIESVLARQVKYTKLENDVNLLEHQIITLKQSVELEIQNRNHFRQLVAEQDRFIQEAKKQIEAYKKSKQEQYDELVVIHKSALKTKTDEAEHLAKQAIRLNQENTLVHEECNALIAENTKFKEQTARLIQENRKLNDAQAHALSKVNAYKKAFDLQSAIAEICELYLTRASKKWFAGPNVKLAKNTVGAFKAQIDYVLKDIAPANSKEIATTPSAATETYYCGPMGVAAKIENVT